MGSAATDSNQRRLMRRKLRARGFSETTIEAMVARHAELQLAARSRGGAPPTPPTTAGLVQSPTDRQLRRARARAEQAEWEAQQELEREIAERERCRLEAETYARLSPDDRKYRPAKRDPLLSGAARATGETAKAVRRGRTATKWQIEERSG